MAICLRLEWIHDNLTVDFYNGQYHKTTKLNETTNYYSRKKLNNIACGDS